MAPTTTVPGPCGLSDFDLYDGVTDTLLGNLCADGSSVVPGVAGLNIEAVIGGGPVTLVLSGPTPLSRTEKKAPYFLGGDSTVTGNIFEMPPLAPGAYSLTATPTAGAPTAVSFTVAP